MISTATPEQVEGVSRICHEANRAYCVMTGDPGLPISQGWVYGPELDRVRKIHPNLVPYDELPAAQRRKDALFLGIVEAVLGAPR